MASNFLLVHVFTAILPPRPPKDQEDDFYEILGLTKKCSQEDIRKAYKKKSLQLHPDKVAQRTGRGMMTAAQVQEAHHEAQQQYMRVQEAYGCLHDAQSRRRYHQLQCSSTWYRFVYTKGGFHHPLAMFENLQQANCMDKTRIVVLVTFFALLLLLQPILIAAKVNQEVYQEYNPESSSSSSGPLASTPWTVVLIPLWVGHGLLLAVLAILTLFLVRSVAMAVVFMECASWLVGEVLLATQWDTPPDQSPYNWHLVSIPFYVALAFRIVSAILAVSDLLHQQLQMISIDQLRVDHPDWTEEQFTAAQEGYRYKSNNNNNKDDENQDNDNENDPNQNKKESEEEEDEKLDFIVVTVDYDAVAQAVQIMNHENNNSNNNNDNNNNSDTAAAARASLIITDEDMEALRVQSSPEFQAASTLIKEQSVSVLYILLFGFTFVALVACKLEGQIQVSWWTVFVPIWVYLGQSILHFFFVCCCLSTGEAVVLVPMPSERQEEGEEESKQNEDEDNNNHQNKEEETQDGGGGEKNKNDIETGTSKTKSDQREPSSSNLFASIQGSIREFNQGKKQQAAAPPQTASRTTAAVEASVEESKDDHEGAQVPPATVPATSPDGTSSRQPEGKNAQDNKSNDNDNNDDGDNNDDDTNTNTQNMPRIDEDTFRAWQHAQEKAEESAMEQQARACSSCCLACFQLIIVCLIVGKLQQDYNPSTSGGEQPASSYSAFWVLFPIFVVVGVLLCCCSCLIYSSGATGSGATGVDDLVERAKQQQQQEQEETNRQKRQEKTAREDEQAQGLLATTTSLAGDPLAADTSADNNVVLAVPPLGSNDDDDVKGGVDGDSNQKEDIESGAGGADLKGEVLPASAAPAAAEVIDMNELD